MKAFTATAAEFYADASRFGREIQVGGKELMDRAAKGMVQTLFQITPPGSREAGEKAIRRDINRIFTGMDSDLLAQAEVLGVGDNVRLFTTKDGRIFGSERSLFRPDASVEAMHDHHAKYWKNGRMSQAGTRTRDIGRWKFVDKMVVSKQALETFFRYQAEKTGTLAAGWIPAANKFGVTVPGWLRGQSGSGSAEFLIGADTITVRIENSVSYASSIKQLQHLVKKAAEYEVNKMERQMPYIMQAAARRAGFKS